MNLKPMAVLGKSPAPSKSEVDHHGSPGEERCLSLLAEGAALSMPEIDSAAYQEFRSSVAGLALQIPDRLDDQEKLPRVKAILQQFEKHRGASEIALRERLTGWRNLSSRLLRELLGSLGIDANSVAVAPLVAKVANLMTADDLRLYQEALDDFLRPRSADGNVQSAASQFKAADRSTANTNAAGLRGGGAAVEHLTRVMERGSRGYVVLFRLGCIEMIHERFGLEAVEDCLMSVSAHLTQSLHSDDAIFHWSDSALMAVVLGRANEQILAAELHRTVARSRDITIVVGGRTIMLRVPVDFDIAAISQLREPSDLYKFSQQLAKAW
jgi:hypothetical protein